MLASHKIGMVGAGKFGKAIATRLAGRVKFYIADELPQKAHALAQATGGVAADVEAVFRESNVVMMIVPPDEIVPLAENYSPVMRPRALLLNLATSVPTSEVQRHVKRKDIHVLGVKPVGQAHAIEHGSKAVFVVTGQDALEIKAVSDILQPIGPCIAGDEMIVQYINAAATRAGLKMIMDLWEELTPMCSSEEVLNVAIQTVAVGTIQDFPPKEPNPYISEQLKIVISSRNTEDQ
jgi:pyrroline-5-carboxylate reductase